MLFFLSFCPSEDVNPQGMLKLYKPSRLTVGGHAACTYILVRAESVRSASKTSTLMTNAHCKPHDYQNIVRYIGTYRHSASTKLQHMTRH